MAQLQSTSVSPREFRKALGHFATGVTVITTVDEGHMRGMTANAFMSVSLDPPLVAVAVDNRSHMHAYLSRTKRYAVNILSREQEALSPYFAGLSGQQFTIPFLWKYDLPLLEGALAHLACRVTDIHPAGDHTLYIAEVEHLDYQGGTPLLFYTGEYRRLEVQVHDWSMW